MELMITFGQKILVIWDLLVVNRTRQSLIYIFKMSLIKIWWWCQTFRFWMWWSVKEKREVRWMGSRSSSSILKLSRIITYVFCKKTWQKLIFIWVRTAYIFFFWNLLRIFVLCLEIFFCYNRYFLVCIFKYRTSSRINYMLEI